MKIDIDHQGRGLIVAALKLLSEQQLQSFEDGREVQRLIHNLQLKKEVPLQDNSSSYVRELQCLAIDQAKKFDAECERLVDKLFYMLKCVIQLPPKHPYDRGDVMSGDIVLYKRERHEVVHVTSRRALITPISGPAEDDLNWVSIEELSFPKLLHSDLPSFKKMSVP